jgi:hypothetical protein
MIGLAAAHLEIEEGLMAFPIEKLQNIHKHHLFHPGDRVRYKCNCTLDQVGMEWGVKFRPGDFSILSLLGRDDMSQEVGPREEPTTTEDVKDVEDRQVDLLRKRGLRCLPSLPRVSVTFLGDTGRGEV